MSKLDLGVSREPPGSSLSTSGSLQELIFNPWELPKSLFRTCGSFQKLKELPGACFQPLGAFGSLSLAFVVFILKAAPTC